MFETIGFRMTQMQGASPWKAFRLRFPWLLATITSGTTAALLAGFFEATLKRALILSFFLALVLALAESVSIQSMSLTLQALRAVQPTWIWFWENARREMMAAVVDRPRLRLSGLCHRLALARHARGGTVIGTTIVGGTIIACLSGLVVPSALHALKLDPKIAAGPHHARPGRRAHAHPLLQPRVVAAVIFARRSGGTVYRKGCRESGRPQRFGFSFSPLRASASSAPLR